MDGQRKSEIYSDVQELTDMGKSLDNKSPVFVPLSGLSQSAKDRLMNNRALRPPKNLNLIEGDPIDSMDVTQKRNIPKFPNEHSLSSKIKEVNGMDYSNHFIEEYFRNSHSESLSPDVSEDSTNMTSTTNESIRYSSYPKETSNSHSDTTPVGSSKVDTDTPLDSSNHHDIDNNDLEAHVDAIDINKFISSSRYSKNAAIIGLLRKNIISFEDLDSCDEMKKLSCSEKECEGANLSCSSNNDEISGRETGKNNSATELDYDSQEFIAHSELVSHPDDPDFFTNRLLAYGDIDDAHIDYRLPRRGHKRIVTPRQYFIQEGLNDDMFQFQPKQTETSKPKPVYNFPPTVDRLRSPRQPNTYNRPSNDSYELVMDEQDTLAFNTSDFPVLHR